MMTQYYLQRVQISYTLHLLFIFLLLCLYYVADLIRKLELCLMVVSVLLKIKFEHAKISMPKIGILMPKTACINPCPLTAWKIKIFKKWEKYLEISFYTCVPKTMIRWCMVLEIWCTVNGQMDRWKKWHRIGCPT